MNKSARLVLVAVLSTPLLAACSAAPKPTPMPSRVSMAFCSEVWPTMRSDPLYGTTSEPASKADSAVLRASAQISYDVMALQVYVNDQLNPQNYDFSGDGYYQSLVAKTVKDCKAVFRAAKSAGSG